MRSTSPPPLLAAALAVAFAARPGGDEASVQVRLQALLT